MPDDGRVEKIFLLNFHRVEHASIGVDADKGSKLWKEVDEIAFSKFFHRGLRLKRRR
jgi:hypothetical protein